MGVRSTEGKLLSIIIMPLFDENERRLSLEIDGQYNTYGYLKENSYQIHLYKSNSTFHPPFHND